MRAEFFGPESSTSHVTERLLAEQSGVPGRERRHPRHRRRRADLPRRRADRAGDPHRRPALARLGGKGAQVNFGVNANGTLNLLEATRAHCPDAPSVFCSTNKVYGDTPNRLPLEELEKRLELPGDHPYHKGIDTSMSIDSSTHSLFGVSKCCRRPAGPGVRPLLRDAHRRLSRRLPERPARAPARSCTASSPT